MHKFFVFAVMLAVLLTACNKQKEVKVESSAVTDSSAEADSSDVVTENGFTILGKWKIVDVVNEELRYSQMLFNADKSASITWYEANEIGNFEQTHTYEFVFTPRLGVGEGEVWDINENKKTVLVYNPDTELLINRDRDLAYKKVEELGDTPYTLIPKISQSVLEKFMDESVYIGVFYTPKNTREAELLYLEFYYADREHTLRPPADLDPIIFDFRNIHQVSVGDFNVDGFMDVKFRRAWGSNDGLNYDDVYLYNPNTNSFSYNKVYSSPWKETSIDLHVMKQLEGEPFEIQVRYFTVAKNQNKLTNLTFKLHDKLYFRSTHHVFFIMENAPGDRFNANRFEIVDYNEDGYMTIKFKGDTHMYILMVNPETGDMIEYLNAY